MLQRVKDNTYYIKKMGNKHFNFKFSKLLLHLLLLAIKTSSAVFCRRYRLVKTARISLNIHFPCKPSVYGKTYKVNKRREKMSCGYCSCIKQNIMSDEEWNRLLMSLFSNLATKGSECSTLQIWWKVSKLWGDCNRALTGKQTWVKHYCTHCFVLGGIFSGNLFSWAPQIQLLRQETFACYLQTNPSTH